MNILIFDTETVQLQKPFCYNIGYKIVDTEKDWHTLTEKDFIVEQIWHNRPLFETAYYAEKRKIYIGSMRSRKTKMLRWYQIMRELEKDIKFYDVKVAFAFNAPFDDRVMDFNAEYFHTANPLETIPLLDIRGFWHCFVLQYDTSFFDWCEENKAFTENGNYSSTAETCFRYVTDNLNFEEAHTALADSRIECDILQYVMEHTDFDLMIDYKPVNSLKRTVPKKLTVKDTNKNILFSTNYTEIRINKDRTEIKLK